MCCGSGENENENIDGNREPGTSGGSGPFTEGPVRGERDVQPQPGGSAFSGSGGRRKRIRRLHCKTGFDVAVYPNGKVRGTKSPRNKYGLILYYNKRAGLLEFESAGSEGEIRIKGTATGFYITMTPKGRIVAQPLAENTGTVWVETRIASLTTYMSLLSLDYGHKGYYLAIKKSGKPKAGHRTNHPYPQSSISFLSRIVSEEFY